jgi:eukaryotic-like serine/threonine-protein kinase
VADEMLVLEPGLVIAQKYRLEKLLKRGGMGAVWVATHLGLETTVAIKFMNDKLLDLPASVEDDDGTISNPRALTRARFEREAKAAARIRSTNVVQMLDHGIDQGTPYIVMEFLRGEDLEVRLKRVGRLATNELLPIVTAIGRALQLAHNEEVIHRDLKPENIFLAQEGDDEIPKILDFGVAKAKNGAADQNVDGSTVQGTMVGTPHYMSPEQIQMGGQVDHRSDLWAFGVLIFRAVTGQLPFPSPRLLELAMQICKDPIPKVTAVAPHLPTSIDAFVEKALCRDPAKRFQSAREMVAAFQEFAAGSSMVTSTSTSSIATNIDLSDKPRRTNRTPMFVLAGVVSVLLVSGGVFAWLRRSPPDLASSAQHAVNPAPFTSSNVPVPSAATSTAGVPEAPSSATTPLTSTKAPVGTSRSVATSATTSTTKTKKRNVGY